MPKTFKGWRVLAWAVMMCCAGLIYLLFLHLPQKEKQGRLYKRLNRLEEEVLEREEMSNNLEKFKKKVKFLEEKLSEKERSLPSSSELPELLGQLERYAKTSGLEIKGVRKTEDTSVSYGSFYSKDYIELNVHSSYPQLRKFLELIFGSDRLVEVSELQVVSGLKKRKPGRIATNMLIEAYSTARKESAHPREVKLSKEEEERLTQKLEEELIKEVREYVGRSFSRPTHVANPTKASLGKELDNCQEEFRSVYETFENYTEEEQNKVTNVFVGKAGVDTLPKDIQRLIVNSRPAVGKILRSTHTESAKGTLKMRSLIPHTDEPVFRPFLIAAALAGCDIRIALKQGEHNRAVDLCVDILALGRDLSFNGDLFGRLSGLTLIRRGFHACKQPIRSSSARRREQLLQQLILIRDNLPPFSVTMQGAELFSLISAFGYSLDSKTVEQFDEGTRKLAESSKPPVEDCQNLSKALCKMLTRITRAELVKGLLASTETRAKYVAAMDIEDIEERDKALVEAQEPMKKTLLGQVAVRPRFENYDNEFRKGKAMLDLLICATTAVNYRIRHKKWPTKANELYFSVQDAGTRCGYVQMQPRDTNLLMYIDGARWLPDLKDDKIEITLTQP